LFQFVEIIGGTHLTHTLAAQTTTASGVAADQVPPLNPAFYSALATAKSPAPILGRIGAQLRFQNRQPDEDLLSCRNQNYPSRYEIFLAMQKVVDKYKRSGNLPP
jgi:hypothetical protein